MWWIAITLGFAGSLHCVGMCSPLAMAASRMHGHALVNRALYNAGRMLTYSVFGAAVSGAGNMLFSFSGFQSSLSVMLGVVLLIVAIAGVGNVRIPIITVLLQRLSSLLKSAFSAFLAKKSYASTLALGALNGLLPCGLTFLALTYCLTLTSPWEGFTFMLVFGAGTLPAMLGLSYLLNLAVQKFHLSIRKMTTVLLIVSGTLLIARVFMGHGHHAHDKGVDNITVCP